MLGAEPGPVTGALVTPRPPIRDDWVAQADALLGRCVVCEILVVPTALPWFAKPWVNLAGRRRSAVAATLFPVAGACFWALAPLDVSRWR